MLTCRAIKERRAFGVRCTSLLQIVEGVVLIRYRHGNTSDPSEYPQERYINQWSCLNKIHSSI